MVKLSLPLLLFVFACHSPQRCPEFEAVRPCVCGYGVNGTQRCLTELAWSACQCPASPDAGGGDAMVGAPPEMEMPSAGGGMMSAPPPSDEDAESPMPQPTGDAAAVDAATADGAAPDAAVVDSAASELPEPFGACTEDADCGAGGRCRSVTGEPPTTTYQVCGAPCSSPLDCELPAGTFDAVAACPDGFCRLDCGVLVETNTCPQGMTCQPLPDLTLICVR